MAAHFTIRNLIFHNKFTVGGALLAPNPFSLRLDASLGAFTRSKIYKLTRLKLIDNVNQSALLGRAISTREAAVNFSVTRRG
jgi:hypothetical protein